MVVAVGGYGYAGFSKRASGIGLRGALVSKRIGFCLAVTAALLAVNSANPQNAPRLHFAANGNFDTQGHFTPAIAGFNIADVSTRKQLDALPQNVIGMVWIGMCNGVDAPFQTAAEAVISHPKLFGFYLMDDPDPTGQWHQACPAANLKAEADWIHERRPESIAFVALMNLSTSTSPSFGGMYTPETTHVDVFSIAPYPCRTEWTKCDYAMIDRYVSAAVASGIPASDLVPTYQTFSLGDWRTESGGSYRMPSDAEMEFMLQRWRRLVPEPKFDFAYSWGSQRSSHGLASSTELQSVFRAHNAGN